MIDQTSRNFESDNLSKLLCPTEVFESNLNREIIKYKKGSYIYRSEDESDKVYFIIDGRIKIGVLSPTRKEIIKTILGKEEIFGELSFVNQASRGEFAYVMEDSKICICTVNELRLLMASHHAFRGYMWQLLGKRIMSVEKRLVSLVFRDSRSRILEFLIDLAQIKGQRVGYETLVRKFNTHQEIASLTATSRQTVTTTLNELRKKKILTFDRKRLLIRDLELLKKESMIAA